jgi:diguanylate cyclase (GGDEF)-like protein
MAAALQLVIVEDSEADAELVSRHLAKAGLRAEIRRVQTEQDFVTALKTRLPDLIISDFSLPQFDGLRALELAAVHAPETPFIYVSGTIGEERAIEALRRGATDYLLKGNLMRLGSAVERALREASLRAAKLKSQQRQQEQAVRLQRLTRTYRMLSSTSSAILRLRNRRELLEEACRIGVQQGGYECVAIGLLDPGAAVLRPKSWAIADSRAKPATGSAPVDEVAASALGESALRAAAPRVVNDLADHPQALLEYGELIARGYQAVAALPLFIEGAAIGVMTVCSAQSGVFDETEVGVLLELCANLGFALQYLEKDEAVHFLSYFDRLTGLAQRPLFCRRLGQMLSVNADAIRTVVVFDVQKLGAINDTLGRDVGDRLIENVAARLKQQFVDSDCLGYFGGGTFVVTLENAGNSTDTGRWLQNAAAQVFVEPFKIDGQELRPVIRSGVAFYPHDGASADSLVQNAEAALKVAREDNEKYMLYGLVTHRPTSRSLALEARLAGALDRHEFLLHYQPKINIENGRIEGLEALLRWRDSEDGLVPPNVFVPLLERSGAIVDVGEWVLLQAVRDIKQWLGNGVSTAIRVAVNVSPLQLRRRDFVDRVLLGVGSLMGSSAGVDIEITESMLMQDLELSILKLSKLREAGIGVAIDDFGTGYSSLRLLARLPVDTLKIDRSFIQGITETPQAMTLVTTVIALARAFGMHTVAEGVETAEQLQLLRQCSCDQAQGYLFARPTPAAEVPAVLARLTRSR